MWFCMMESDESKKPLYKSTWLELQIIQVFIQKTTLDL